ncbi:MAG: aspartate aminotransferase family protein [Robiginitomaculum sp.]|nr:MAG: aspartate aminotransferase family protein [Robiginitomaculum sp.]
MAVFTQATDAYWMPFTPNRAFKKNPRILTAARGMYYETIGGQKILDGCAGLWCVNAGHANQKINHAIKAQLDRMSYSPAFQLGHNLAFEFAERLADLFPGDLNHVFFTNSGSESVETALKIARAYHQANGNAQKLKFIGRERGYHGVNIGGLSVGGIMANRQAFGPLLPEVDHLPHTHDLAKNAFSKGQPETGADKADRLFDLIALHGAHTIAAVIVEPMAGSTGVLIPPKGYLEKLRKICNDHDILLIFDEVITAFGRLGDSCAAAALQVQPDLMTLAKGLTNGAVPMGAVMISDKIHDAMMSGPENSVELFHGYTCSGHPLACAAGLASLDVYAEEALFSRANDLAPYWQNAIHSLGCHDHVIDVRNIGLVGAIELEPRVGAPGMRAYEAYLKAFESGLLVRTTGDIIALSPPLIISTEQIDFIVHILNDVLKTLK